jgi:hypothetical protein
LRVYFDLGSGSTYRGTAGAWAASGLIGATSAVRVISTLSATFDLTGVQLEVGNAATEFERRPYGFELSLCQRYARIFRSDAGNACILPGYVLANATTGGYGPVHIPVTMRIVPALTVSATADLSLDTSGSAAALTSVGIYGGFTTDSGSVFIQAAVAAGLTSGQTYMLKVNTGTGKWALLSAEL